MMTDMNLKLSEVLEDPRIRLIAADAIRNMLTEKGIFFLNVMSSPGSGKTTLLTALINRMKDKVLRYAMLKVSSEE